MQISPKKILIVDIDNLILDILKEKIDLLDYIVDVFIATSYKEGLQIIIENNGDIHAAIINFNLPDAHNTEMVKYTIDKCIPTVVIMDDYSYNLKERLFSNDILEYISKDSKKGINNSIRAINRILVNKDTTVLIVDDSKIQRDILKEILQGIKLNVITANSSDEALHIIKEMRVKITIVLADYKIANKDEIGLTQELREDYDKDELGIIGLSNSSNPEVLIEFIKIGANDFIEKPYSKTEVIVRVNSLLHIMQLFDKKRELSFKDYLTGAYNRRYFYTSGTAIFDKAIRENRRLAVSTIDIDDFKHINDTHGHNIGDLCIIEVVKILNKNLRGSDLLSRFGGDEFVILLENITLKNTQTLFERIRNTFENNEIKTHNGFVKFTVSIGIFYGREESLVESIKVSDEALYYSKENGRNQIKVIER